MFCAITGKQAYKPLLKDFYAQCIPQSPFYPAGLAVYITLDTFLPMRATVQTLLLVLMLYAGSVAAAKPFTGSWEHRGPNESGLWLDTEQNQNLVKFQLEVSRGAPSYNTGWIQGEIELKNNVGYFRKSTDSGLCEITFHFQEKRVELKHTGDYSGCGFGHNVFAIGVLKRVNSKQPKFCAGDPRSGGCE